MRGEVAAGAGGARREEHMERRVVRTQVIRGVVDVRDMRKAVGRDAP